jgi:hypothetical protein
LIKVPLKAGKFLERNCKNLHQTCLTGGEFQEIIDLHDFVIKFQSILRVEVEIINLKEVKVRMISLLHLLSLFL